MNTILIVDDEDIIRRGLTATIKKHGMDKFEVIGMGHNGSEGLELIKRFNPDIVLSDIKMPIMSGLDMFEQSKKLGISPKVIFLSGFDEFEYVKKAMNLEAENYLLKPISPTDLMSALQAVAKQISDENILKRQIYENMPVMKQSFIHNLLTKPPIEDKNILDDIGFYNLQISEGSFLVLIFKVDDYNNKDYLDTIMDNELCKFAAYNISTELLSNEYKTVTYYSDNDEFVIIINSTAVEDVDVSKVYDIGYDICEKVEKLLKTTVTIGVGRFYQSFSGISKSYYDAVNAIEFKHILGKNRIITIEDINLFGRTENADHELNSYKDRLILEIKLREKERAVNTLREIQDLLLGDKSVSLSKIRIIAIELLVMVIKEMSNWSNDHTKSFQNSLHTVAEKINSLNTIYDIFNTLSVILNDIFSVLNKESNNPQKMMVEQAVSFIAENYSSESLSLRDVARHVHISSSYLSTIFKQEIDENFIDYLTRIRMENAKLLLRNESWKAYEVASKVGYSNPQYFSLCFKKYTGHSPLQFKTLDQMK
ncbi:response regulator [Paenibacillus sp. LHD-38]|uniref:response regulator n=1 Tax=Paenibacillus sp. LHD-38 TaxID=3072143 RepID=UPI00280D8F28|nr:response regulator [Paenibacillus sp. LHD-38]MDQ8736203.1 response regulator [Paenibacillus sp. LHD-38]